MNYHLKDIIYLTLLRQKIDGSVFDADFQQQASKENLFEKEQMFRQQDSSAKANRKQQQQQQSSIPSEATLFEKLECKSTQRAANQLIDLRAAEAAAANGITGRLRASLQNNPSQLRRKRGKLLDVLLNANWSKKSQQASNFIKLNKILLTCDPNFLDEKSGQSPLSLIIASAQINATQLDCNPINGFSDLHDATFKQKKFPINYSQSASLFDLQSSSHQLMLNNSLNVSDLAHSKAPLIERLVLLLVKCGAQIDFRNSDAKTALHVAAIKSNFWALKALLDLGASTDQRDINGLTPLYYSILHKANLKVTQLLLNYSNTNLSSKQGNNNANCPQQVSIGITDQHGWQEVHQACKLGLDAHLEKLLYYGCDLNAKISGSGNTPLHVSAINDQLNCAKVLMMRGADKTITNNSHQTAHQMAVISQNMDLAEFIMKHNTSQIVLFNDRPANYVDMSSSSTLSNRSLAPTNVAPQAMQHSPAQSSTRLSSLATSQSSASICQNQTSQARSAALVYPQPQAQQVNSKVMNPLSLDVGCVGGSSGQSSSAALSNTSMNSLNNQPSSAQTSLLSVTNNNNNPLNVHVSNISPSYSQQSCATSNTTSSSGVCCEVDSSGEELHKSHNTITASNTLSQSQSQHSNVTIIAINNNGTPASAQGSLQTDEDEDEDENEEGERSSSSGSSNSGLYSLMSEERPLFAGTLVEATSEYRSGDPSHLELKRSDLIEVLECAPELLQGGQLPRLANKPMIFGRRLSDNQSGLFPSFCVHRAKQRKQQQQQLNQNRSSSSSVKRTPMNELTNCNQSSLSTFQQKQQQQNFRGNNLPESQSMAAILVKQTNVADQTSQDKQDALKLKFREFQVTLNKTRSDGFGFVLRGAKVDPATLVSSTKPSAAGNGQPPTNRMIIDERLMTANNLISLQYLDEIEQASVAHEAGLKRGDFLVAVNQQDVRLSSHEQVVHMIRQSGDQVQLTIATPVGAPAAPPTVNQPNYISKTLGRVKPEPPKRDPSTTLTRNQAQRVRSMMVQPQQQVASSQRQPDLFDANKPLPMAPAAWSQLNSPTGSLNTMGRSVSTNMAHFQSANSLTSNPETQSISSLSSASADQQQQRQMTPTQSSSSTTTLTTVAAQIQKPKAPPKPNQPLTSSGASPTTYQSAVITTKRVANSSPHQSPPKAPPSSVSSGNRAGDASLPPPPPPPMPNFEAPRKAEQCSERILQRRTSAPANQISSSILNSKVLAKKRESLAAIGSLQVGSTGPTVPAPPAQFGAVAAACAAAANNRLQRQQQLVAETKSEAPKLEEKSNPVVAKENPLVEKEKPRALEGENLAPKTSQVQQQMSATLGRRSSAQIIQQPKQPQQHSQTLKAAKPKQRPSLPNYDELPPPPPPLTPDDETQGARLHRQQHHHNHNHHHHHHQHQQYHHQQQVVSGPEIQIAASKRAQEYISQQPLMILNQQQQQQLIKQQLRQQQLLQQHQQQMKLQQQLCLAANQQQARYSSSSARGQLLHEPLLNQHQHQHQQLLNNPKADGHRHHHHHHHPHQQAHLHYRQEPSAVAPQAAQHFHQHHIAQQAEFQQSQANNLLAHHHSHANQHHHHLHQQQPQQQQQQQQLYQQQYIEQYLPLVYSTDSYATLTRDS